MAKTMKVLDIQNGAINFCCIKQFDATINPYRLYHREWRDGTWHRKLIVRYQDFQSVIWYVLSAVIRQNWNWRE